MSENQGFKAVLLLLMGFVAVGAAALIVVVLTLPTSPLTGASIPAPNAPSVSGVAAGFENPAYTRVLFAIFIFVTAAILEIVLMLLYAAFFVNQAANVNLPLGLPLGTVRVFLIATLILITLLFALVPDAWGSNKAVVLLFGFIATIIGFYFGSRATASGGSSGSTVKLTIKTDTVLDKTQSGGATVEGTLDKGYDAVLGSPLPPIVSQLLTSSGQPVGAVSIGIVDASGAVQFDFSDALATATAGSYLVRVIAPSDLTCDGRISVK